MNLHYTSKILILLELIVFSTARSDAVEDFTPILDPNIYVEESDNYTMFDVERLLADKLAKYNRLVRPKMDHSKPLHIKAGFLLSALRGFDEVNEKFSIVGGILLQWIDDRMKWNVSDYGGVKTFIVENGNFWTPTMVLVNAFDKFQKIGEDPYWPIRFFHTGHAQYTPGDVMTSTCSADVTYYPWDTQACAMQFAGYTYLESEIQISPLTEEISMIYYNGHGEWDILSTDTETQYGNVVVRFIITFKRKPLFVVLNVILPIIVMSALNTFVFLIPAESGERISYGMTVLLAITVFLTIIGDNLPKSSRPIAVLSYYLLSLLVLSVLEMLATIINLRFYFATEDQPVPNCCCRLIECLRRRSKTSGSKESNGEQRSRKTPDPEINVGSGDHYFLKGRKIYIPEPSQESSIRQKRAENRPEKNGYQGSSTDRLSTSFPMVTWKEVSSVLDGVLFILSWLFLLISTTWFFVYVIQ